MDNNDRGLLALLTKRLTELQAAFRTLSKQQGPKGLDGKDGKDGLDGKPGKDGNPGKDGKPGKDGEDGKDGVDGKDGKDGALGPKPDHRWIGTRLQFEKPDGTWGKSVNLKGESGKDGTNTVARVVASVGGNNSGGNFDIDLLPGATSALPEEFIVRQDGAWVRASYAQMAMWLGGGGLPANVATVAGEAITVGGEFVTVTE